MPFTPSHAAAALPFLRTPLLPAAVVIGTMAPDIPYYLPLFVPRDLSHSLLGLVTVDLALGVIGALLWWFVLREPVIDVLPRAVGARIPTVGRLAWRPRGWGWPLTAVVLLLSSLVGGATHLVWDSFTHAGWLVDHVAVLRVELGPLPLDKWLQHLSSIGGLVILAVWAVRRLRRTNPDAARSTRFTAFERSVAEVFVVAAGAIGVAAPWLHGLSVGVPPFDPDLVFLAARIGVAAACAAVALVVILWFILGRIPRRRPGS